MASLAIVLVILGVRVVNLHISLYSLEFMGILVKALFAGLLIGLIEEALFRGALFSVLQEALNVTGTIVFTAFLICCGSFHSPLNRNSLR